MMLYLHELNGVTVPLRKRKLRKPNFALVCRLLVEIMMRVCVI